MPSATVSIVRKHCSTSSKNLPTLPALLPNEQSDAQRLPRCDYSTRESLLGLPPCDRMDQSHEGDTRIQEEPKIVVTTQTGTPKVTTPSGLQPDGMLSSDLWGQDFSFIGSNFSLMGPHTLWVLR